MEAPWAGNQGSELIGYAAAWPTPPGETGVVYHTAIVGSGYRMLVEGAKVSFVAEVGPKRPKAVQCTDDLAPVRPARRGALAESVIRHGALRGFASALRACADGPAVGDCYRLSGSAVASQ